MASRHLARALVLQTLFESDMMHALALAPAKAVLERNAAEFSLGGSDIAFAESLLAGVISKQAELDAVMVRAAPQWPLDKIAPIDRNVLRIGLYELLFADRSAVPPKVALNEAIEIAKSFGGDASGKFVNGVLGAVYRDIGEPQKDAASQSVARTEALGGAVVLCRENGEVRVALVRDAFGRWTLPKARLQESELTESAARRAIRDELGIDADIEAPLTEHAYVAHEPGVGPVQRTVAYVLARAAHAPLAPQPHAGVVEAQWFATADLADVPMYDELRAIIEAGVTRFV